MTKQEFATLVVAMQAMYGEDFIGTEQALDVWYACLILKSLRKRCLHYELIRGQ